MQPAPPSGECDGTMNQDTRCAIHMAGGIATLIKQNLEDEDGTQGPGGNSGNMGPVGEDGTKGPSCLLYTSPSPRDS